MASMSHDAHLSHLLSTWLQLLQLPGAAYKSTTVLLTMREEHSLILNGRYRLPPIDQFSAQMKDGTCLTSLVEHDMMLPQSSLAAGNHSGRRTVLLWSKMSWALKSFVKRGSLFWSKLSRRGGGGGGYFLPWRKLPPTSSCGRSTDYRNIYPHYASTRCWHACIILWYSSNANHSLCAVWHNKAIKLCIPHVYHWM